ncbi:hypothetical protein IVB14_09410 [Bradyrhizobium sp. 180]|nr:hypothetical protein [Bradyrhizobium sp. 180]MCK1490623.1 hypothetical protein [Bradyrhizobium sp. 180]
MVVFLYVNTAKQLGEQDRIDGFDTLIGASLDAEIALLRISFEARGLL